MRDPSDDPPDAEVIGAWKPAGQGDSATAANRASGADRRPPDPGRSSEASPPPTAGAFASNQVREAAVGYFPELVFRLDPQLSDRLRMTALAQQRPPTALAAELLRRGLERETRRERAEAALAILTPREREVARLTVVGHTNQEIARRLVISPETVKTHMRNLLAKFSLSSKAELRLRLQDLDKQP